MGGLLPTEIAWVVNGSWIKEAGGGLRNSLSMHVVHLYFSGWSNLLRLSFWREKRVRGILTFIQKRLSRARGQIWKGDDSCLGNYLFRIRNVVGVKNLPLIRLAKGGSGFSTFNFCLFFFYSSTTVKVPYWTRSIKWELDFSGCAGLRRGIDGRCTSSVLISIFRFLFQRVRKNPVDDSQIWKDRDCFVGRSAKVASPRIRRRGNPFLGWFEIVRVECWESSRKAIKGHDYWISEHLPPIRQLKHLILRDDRGVWPTWRIERDARESSMW